DRLRSVEDGREGMMRMRRKRDCAQCESGPEREVHRSLAYGYRQAAAAAIEFTPGPQTPQGAVPSLRPALERVLDPPLDQVHVEPAAVAHNLPHRFVDRAEVLEQI